MAFILFKGVFKGNGHRGFTSFDGLFLIEASVYKCELYVLSLKLCYKTDNCSIKLWRLSPETLLLHRSCETGRLNRIVSY